MMTCESKLHRRGERQQAICMSGICQHQPLLSLPFTIFPPMYLSAQTRHITTKQFFNCLHVCMCLCTHMCWCMLDMCLVGGDRRKGFCSPSQLQCDWQDQIKITELTLINNQSPFWCPNLSH